MPRRTVRNSRRRKRERVEAASERESLRNTRSNEEQLAELDRRGVRAARERARLGYINYTD